MDQGSENLLNHNLVLVVIDAFVFIRAIPGNVVKMAQDIEAVEFPDTVENRTEILVMGLILGQTFEEFPVVEFGMVDDMDRSDHKFERTRFDELIDLIDVIEIKPDLDPDFDFDLVLIFLLELLEFQEIVDNVQFEIVDGIIEIVMIRETDLVHAQFDRLDYIGLGSLGRIERMVGMDMEVDKHLSIRPGC